MKRLTVILATILLISACTASIAEDHDKCSGPEALLVQAADYVIGSSRYTPDFNWGEGVQMDGMMCASETAHDPMYLNYVEHFGYFYHIYNIAPVLAKKGYCGHWGPGFSLVKLYDHTGDKRFLDMAVTIGDFILQDAARSEECGLYHHFKDTLYWCDTLYMAAPVLTHLTRATGDAKYHDEAMDQCLIYARTLQDPDTGVYAHAWSPDKKKIYGMNWARGNGWVAMANIEVLKNTKKGTADYDRLAKIVEAQLTGLAKLQDTETGLWHTVVDRPDMYVEASGSAMITYAMCEAMRYKLIDADLRQTVDAAWSGLSSKLESDGRVTGVSEGTGPSLTPENYSERKLHTYTWGTGAWLMAASSYKELVSPGSADK